MLEDPLSIEIHIHLSMYMLRSTLVKEKVKRFLPPLRTAHNLRALLAHLA